MSTSSNTKFAASARASRYEKDKVTKGDGEDMYKPLSFGRKPFHKSQILVETDKFFVVSPIRVEKTGGDELISVCLNPGWSLVTEIATGATKLSWGQDTSTILRPGFGHETVHMVDVDKALNVLQDMGRWDIAFKVVMDLLNVQGDVVPAASVTWEKFPHKSKMLFFTSERTGIYLGGVMKDVVEKWWAYCGGYHNKSGLIPVVPRDEYDDFMAGVRNPFVLAGVDRGAIYAMIAKHLHPVEWLPEDITLEMVGARKYWVHDRVIYLVDTDGFVLPYWYTNIEDGPAPEHIAWDKDMVRKLAGYMNLPLLVQRRTDVALGR